jgi:2',3'-cyclic-nucleotide 2'-phosphodiesterase (5'-nucleotidase family)
MLDGLKLFKTDVINLSTEDLYYTPALNQALAVKEARKEGSLSVPFISANIRLKSSQIPGLEPYLTRTIALPGLAKSKTIRVTFIGLADNEKYQYPPDMFEVSDPLVAAKKIVPEVKAKSDLVVVLADLPRAKAVNLAVQNNDIDLIITGYKYPYMGPPEKINNATIVTPAFQGRYLGELRVYTDARGEVERYQARSVMLDSGIPDEPEAASLMVRARAEISALQKRQAAAQPVSTTVKEIYAGSARCAACHVQAYETWKQTRHAQALDTLKAKNQEFNPQCLTCHTTGYGKEGGFVNATQTPQFANVHCEQCHGPGLEHAAKPGPGYGRVGQPGCLGCHTSIDSPNFDFATAWQKIKH